MTRLDSYHDPRAVRAWVERIRRASRRAARRTGGRVTFMEVCGTHTHSIAEAGLRRLLPPEVRLISGPGCPVCVTPIDTMDRAVALARRPDTILCTFGDLMRVPSSTSSLERESAAGADVRIVYSARDALPVARAHPERFVVFLAVGFETTLPTIAAAIAEADLEGLDNFLVLPGAKLIEPPLRALVADGEVDVDGFLLPGHVSVVLGSDFYGFLEEELGVPGVVVGFTPVDVLRGVYELVRMVGAGRPHVANLYARVVTPAGNRLAREVMARFFEPADTRWRGLGSIPLSGLELRAEYAHRDATRLVGALEPAREPPGCRCGEILKGVIEPPECPLFDRACTPDEPVGACMVSSEGTCAAWYRHERGRLGGRQPVGAGR